MSELKPCPFCGGKNVLSTELQDGLPFIAYCQCGAENEAENWNTRPIEDELRKRIAELESAQRWIPVSERLPEEDTDSNALMAICRYSGEWVRTAFGAEFADEFVRHYTHWMYAPEPPEAQE